MTKKKEKKQKKKTCLDELETLTFEQKILENNRQLARLRARNDALELEAEQLRGKLKELDESKKDLTSHLQIVLQKKTAEAEELQEKLAAVKDLRREENEAFKKKEEMMLLEYKAMEHQLTSEIKLATGKLNALDDWRLSRIDLMKKFEEQEVRMAEQEVRHKETLYETEKKFIIDKAKMQNELEARLRELAQSFRDATQLRLADATQRAVRENTALSQELNKLLKYCLKLDVQMRELKEREHAMRLIASLYDTQANMALRKVTNQDQYVQELSQDQIVMRKAIVKATRAKQFLELSDEAQDAFEKKKSNVEHKSRLLEQRIQLNRESKEATLKAMQENCREVERLTGILADAKNAIQEALTIQEDITEGEGEEDACSSCFFEIKEKLLHTLLNILANYEPFDDEGDEVTQTESEVLDDLYEFGCLGLIPGAASAPSTKSASEVTKSTISDDRQKAEEDSDKFPLTHCSCD